MLTMRDLGAVDEVIKRQVEQGFDLIDSPADGARLVGDNGRVCVLTECIHEGVRKNATWAGKTTLDHALCIIIHAELVVKFTAGNY